MEKPKALNDNATKALHYLGQVQAAAAVNAVAEPTVQGQWERVDVIMDSGANVTVGPSSIGDMAGYRMEESPASRAGVMYTAANGGDLPNLGQKFLAVLTEEGTVRGVQQQCADVTKPLEAIRDNVRTGHVVIFDDDGSGQGTGSVMINKFTGEVNAIHDNGSDYVMRRWIIPVQDVDAVIAEASFRRQG